MSAFLESPVFSDGDDGVSESLLANWSNLLKYREKSIYRWPVHFSSTQAKLVVIMRISSYSRPQLATHFSEGTARVSRFGPPPEPREATLVLLKTRNRLLVKWPLRVQVFDQSLMK